MRKLTPMPKQSISSQAVSLVMWLAIVFAAAAIGSIGSSDAGTFYAQLSRPSLAPPASVFGPVWSVLYVLMGIAAWLVSREQGARNRKAAITLFMVQLAANALWSWLFFYWHNGALAFAEILVLLALIAATMVMFWRISRLAAILMVPYFVWVCLASVLMWTVWHRNPQLL